MTNGKLHVVDPTAYQRDIEKMQLGDGEEVEIRITKAEEAKRSAQLRLWFALVREISEFTGYDVRELHEMAKQVVRAPDAPASMADYSKCQMTEAIDGLLRWSAETIGLPLDVPHAETRTA